jgi:hypothetical protein
MANAAPPDPEFELPADAALQAPDPEHGLPHGFGEGLKGRVLFWIAVVFSAFQVATAAYPVLPSQIVRAVHVGFPPC